MVSEVVIHEIQQNTVYKKYCVISTEILLLQTVTDTEHWSTTATVYDPALLGTVLLAAFCHG